MNMRKKTLMAVAAAAALMTATVAKADTNPANDSGSFTVRITPNVDLGVTVDTTGSKWAGAANLDMSADLGSDTLLDNTGPINVAMTGNFNNQELTLTGAALNTWTLDTDEADAENQLRLYAMLSDSALATSPNVATITGAQNLITTVATRAGQPAVDEGGDTNHVYELSTGAGAGVYADVDGMTATATRKLWLRAHTPSTSSTDEQAAFTVTVTAVTGLGL